VDAAPTGAPADGAILVANGVNKTFGGLAAVDVEHLAVRRGAITALIGPNGAGKTTFFNVLTGFDGADGGSWVFDGVELGGRPPHRIARAGLVRTFQLTKALSRMSVLDNMKLAAPSQRGEHFFGALVRPRWKAQEAEVEAKARGLLERFRLDRLAEDYAGTLSGGQRKLLEMARALMTEPRMLLLDEPMAGVNPALVESLLEHIKELPAEGRTVLFIEHDMDVVMGISHHVVCMAEGRVIAEGRPQEIAADDRVIDAYLGTHRAERHRGPRTEEQP
jgi:branched-chain amino acid transport system ATP-binding protein